MPRLGSKKSRGGCRQCKTRRVKCDENRPCANCARYEVECSLLHAPPQPPPTPPAQLPATVTATLASTPGSTSTSSSDGTRMNQSAGIPAPMVENSSLPLHGSTSVPSTPAWPHQPYPETEIPPPSMLPPIPSPNTTIPASHTSYLPDLELMHHYTAFAHRTLPGSSTTSYSLWAHAVPQEAFKHPFLLHSLLSFSANHLAYLNPSRMSSCSSHCNPNDNGNTMGKDSASTATKPIHLLASTHQAHAITLINSALHQNIINAANCHALFAAALLVSLNAFADKETRDLEGLIECFRLLRGADWVLQKTEDMVRRGPFAALLNRGEEGRKGERDGTERSWEEDEHGRGGVPLLAGFLADIQALSDGWWEEVVKLEGQDQQAKHATPGPSPEAKQQRQKELESEPGSWLRAAGLLRDCLQYCMETTTYPAMRTVVLFPIRGDMQFFERLKEGREREPMAWRIWDTYRRVLEFAGTNWWFLAGWRGVERWV